MTTIKLLAASAALVAATACVPEGADPESDARPRIEPEKFTTEIDNPRMPMAPGDRWVYEGETDEGVERIVVQVLDTTREVMGVDTVVVRDTVRLDGALVEDTYDWFAQDDLGNVWYFGEESWEYEDGERTSSDGSWEAGVDGAEPGIVMLAFPEVGDHYRQEWYEGEAEDEATVEALDDHVSVPYGDFDGVLRTLDVNPLERGSEERKYYAPDVGLVLEVAVDSGERVELVEVTRR